MTPLLSLSLPVPEARSAWSTLGGAADLIGELVGASSVGPAQAPAALASALNELLELAAREASAEGELTLALFEDGHLTLILPTGDTERPRLNAAVEALSAPEGYSEALVAAAQGADDPTLAWRALGAEASLRLLSAEHDGAQLILTLDLSTLDLGGASE